MGDGGGGEGVRDIAQAQQIASAISCALDGAINCILRRPLTVARWGVIDREIPRLARSNSSPRLIRGELSALGTIDAFLADAGDLDSDGVEWRVQERLPFLNS